MTTSLVHAPTMSMSAWHRSLPILHNTSFQQKTANVLLFTESHGKLLSWQLLEEKHDTNGGTLHGRGSSCTSQTERGDGNKAYQAEKASWLQGNGWIMASQRLRLEGLYRGATAQVPAKQLTTSQKHTSPLTLWRVRSGP